MPSIVPTLSITLNCKVQRKHPTQRKVEADVPEDSAKQSMSSSPSHRDFQEFPSSTPECREMTEESQTEPVHLLYNPSVCPEAQAPACHPVPTPPLTNHLSTKAAQLVLLQEDYLPECNPAKKVAPLFKKTEESCFPRCQEEQECSYDRVSSRGRESIPHRAKWNRSRSGSQYSGHSGASAVVRRVIRREETNKDQISQGNSKTETTQMLQRDLSRFMPQDNQSCTFNHKRSSDYLVFVNGDQTDPEDVSKVSDHYAKLKIK